VERENRPVTDFFDTAYEGTPPWDIGRPQAAVVRLAEAGDIVGSVLDVGCGTGENAMFLAERGHEVVGVDRASAAVERATRTAHERDLRVEFLVWDALRLGELNRAFDTAIDIGMFHTISDAERPVYAESLHEALGPGGRCFLLCWSERNPWGYGPRRVTQMELRGTFERGWNVESVEGVVYEGRHPDRIHAWLATLLRS
jgi:cyclopropane fatty-acyl-phospholipid synthase-like methyltransferase